MKQSMWIKPCLLLLLLFFAIGNGSVCASDKLVLQLPWHHQFQFAGYYMAEEQGYYRDAGLSVEIHDITQGSNPIEGVLSGRVDFGVSGPGLIVERSQGKPVVAVASIFQQSPTVFLSLEQSGIREPADFIGKKVMLSPGYQSLPLLALLLQEKLLDKIERLETSFDSHSLLNGQTDVFNGYSSNEPYQLEAQGYATNIIDPAEYGINFYGDTLFTSETFIQKHPEVTESFRQASLRGWEYAVAHPDAAIAVIQAKYKCQKTVAALRYEAAETIKLIQADQVEIGDMDLLCWRKISRHLIALGMVSPDFYLSKHFLYDPPPGIPWKKLHEGIIGVFLGLILLTTVVFFVSKKNFQLKTIQKQLEKEKYFSISLIDTAQIIILVLDPQGRIISFNPYMEKITGY
ncbi:MAG: ABC transporter substrate-binding protein, partial [Desulfuromusa sp.]|nr:ABC transporter substrate-binding protein [Desulfuromusa sp.]